MKLTSAQIRGLRLRSLALAPGTARATVAGAARHLLCVQGQDWRSVRMALALRTPGATDADVLAAFDAGEIVRTWTMRGTIHCVSAEDAAMMLRTCGERALSGARRRREDLGLAEDDLERARATAVDVLHGGGRLTRDGFRQVLTDAGLDHLAANAYHVIWFLAQTGTLIWGPTRDGEQQLVLSDEWLPKVEMPSEPMAEIAARYATARGPVRLEDFVHWTAQTKTACRAGLEAAAEDGRLAVVEGPGGGAMYLASEVADAGPARSSALLALPAFDEHLLGYANREDVLDRDLTARVDPQRNGVFRATLVRNGRVVATLARKALTRRVRITASLFPGEKAPAQESLDRAIAGWTRVSGVPHEIAVAEG